MRGINKLRSPRAFAALVAALGLLLGTGAGSVALAQAGSQARPPYHSSIQVPRDKHEAGEADEGNEHSRGKAAERKEHEGKETAGKESDEAASPAERAEMAQLQKLARITADQARSAALAQVPGTATISVLENEDGNLVYGVTVKTTAGEKEVKVDAGNGKVLHVEQGEEND
jgi:uncharacterized membrane protein YkoI